MKLRNLLVCSVLAFAPSCSKGGDAQVEKMVSMMEEMGAAVDAAGKDCTKMADGLDAVYKKYEGDIKGMKDLKEKYKGDKDKAKELMEKYGDRMQKVMPKLMGMMECASDPKMKELQSKMDGMM